MEVETIGVHVPKDCPESVKDLLKCLFKTEVELFLSNDCEHPKDKWACVDCDDMASECNCHDCTVTCLDCGDTIEDEHDHPINCQFYHSIDAVLTYKKARERKRDRLIEAIQREMDFYLD